ncbi:HAD family phosphatase [Nitrosospira lacus]|uniref:Haloacid dehalogenase n=1 Tax=Nitrosospira lacus TaxID=1288494 RepID=A0A1W6SRA1_9PROT|nr:Cof-type HAD-IIB family hydrolase [Nitrosospira lacus]ARO88295.1 HAD family phosphatase [Nitrosospira lacus]
MSKLRAVALDVDGTLLNSSHNVSPAVKKSIHDIWQQGIQVILASGRHVGSLSQLLMELGIEGYVVAFSGGAVARVDLSKRVEIILQHRLELAHAEAMAHEALSNGLSVAWSTLDHWYTPDAMGLYRQEARILRQEPVVVPGLRGLSVAPHKLQIMSHNAEGIVCLRAMRDAISSECSAVFSHDYMLEIMPKGINKAAGLTRIGQIHGMTLSEMVAIGDAENDIEMLRHAGLGVAMGHAPHTVKAVADWITLTNGEDGVAFALEQDWLRQRFFGVPG